MKKLLTTMATSLILTTGTAAAQDGIIFDPYIGIDLTRTHYSYESENLGGGATIDYDTIAEDNLTGINIHVGSRFHKYFGAELGYFRTQEEEKTVAAGSSIGTNAITPIALATKIQTQGVTLDALGYLPVPQTPVELIGTAGLTWTKADYSLNAPAFGQTGEDDDDFGVRVGGGAQFNVTETVNIRALARYEHVNLADVIDNGWTYSLGANYSF